MAIRAGVIVLILAVLTFSTSCLSSGQAAAAAAEPSECVSVLKTTRSLAETGDTDAQVQLGNMFMDGSCIGQDYHAAALWFGRAASKGNAVGEYDLAYMYYNPRSFGVVPAAGEMVRLYMASARQGFSPAQNWIGTAYIGGFEGHPKDFALAYMWLTLAMRTKDAEDSNLAAGNRDTLAVTSTQIARAKTLAGNCLNTHYTDCGDTYARSPHPASLVRIPLKYGDGAWLVPVRINDVMTLDFLIDSGSTDVSVPADVVSTLVRTGAVTARDFVGTKTYMLADGTTVPSPTFTIRVLKIGPYELRNVLASVSNSQGPLLLGQSALKKFESWSIDNANAQLVLQ